MTSSSLIEASGSSHHADHPLNLKSKVTAPFGLVQANYGKEGPTLSVQQKNVLGGAITAASPKLETFDFLYTKKADLHDGRGSLNASIGINAPLTSLLDPHAFLPRGMLKYGYGKGFLATLTSKFNKNYEAEIVGDLALQRKFDVASGVKGLVKADLKQSIYNQSKPLDIPAVNISAILNEKSGEYGVTYASKKNRLYFFHAAFLPSELKMHRYINMIIPTAIGFKLSIPVDKMSSTKKWERTGLASFALSRTRSKDASTALNLMIQDTDIKATVLRKDTIQSGESNKMSVVYSLSAKASLKDAFGYGNDSFNPSWGVKVDLVGDVSEFPLANAFNF